MLGCGYDCFTIDSLWIAENPDCPIHGVQSKSKTIVDSDEKREVLYRLWCREINADEAFDILFNAGY